MPKTYLYILTLITFAIHTVRSDDTIEALKKILEELNAPIEERYDDVNHNSKIVYHPRHYKHGKSKQSRGSPNLMNVQTMNLFLKPNKRQREEADVKRFFRTDTEENICKSTGRCGCTGSRCGTNREDDLADEIDRVINEINKQLARDDDEWENDGDVVHTHAKWNEKNRDKVRKMDDEYDGERDRRDEDRIKIHDRYDYDDDIKQDRDDYDDHDNRDRSLVAKKYRIDKNVFLNGKRIKVNDNLDVVILDKSDLDVLLRNKDFIDLTRSDVDKDDEDSEIYEKVHEEFKKFIAAEDQTDYRSSDAITPEQFFGHYQAIKQQVVVKVFNYIKNNKKLLTSLNLKHLSPNQKSKLRSIKLKYERGEIQDDVLEEEIVNIIFGEQSNMKIVAQTENNNKIYIPKWLYDKVLNSKKSLNNILRGETNVKAQKRILPLTLQQKERFSNNKEKGKNNPKLVWRKNTDQNVQRLGIPFNFMVHGLGQMAP